MGLTAAEAFMLIAFILLILLVLWRVTANQEKERLLDENARLAAVIERAGDPEVVADALAFHEQFSRLSPDEMKARLDLMEDEKLRALVSEAQALPKDGLLELIDLTRDEVLPGVRERLDMLKQIGLRPDEVAEMQNALSSAENDQRRLYDELARLSKEQAAFEQQITAFSETGLTPGDIRAMEATLAELGERQQSLARTGAEIAATIRDEAGDRIAALGGQVLPDGDVIFPDAILFDAGGADIHPEFNTLLQSFCRLWFETLYEQRGSLETVQVEGHASSEFGMLIPEQAFVRNLDLSQRRAAAVFARCLTYGGDDEITDWARSSMAAVGYSSSRVIIENGVENRTASRRVVFALEPNTESQMARAVLEQPNSQINLATAPPRDAVTDETRPTEDASRGRVWVPPVLQGFSERTGQD